MDIDAHIVKRTLVLILLGLVDYGLLRFDWDPMRWSTVLGRIGIRSISRRDLLPRHWFSL